MIIENGMIHTTITFSNVIFTKSLFVTYKKMFVFKNSVFIKNLTPKKWIFKELTKQFNFYKFIQQTPRSVYNNPLKNLKKRVHKHVDFLKI